MAAIAGGRGGPRADTDKDAQKLVMALHAVFNEIDDE